MQKKKMEVRIARLDTCPKPSHVVGFTILHQPSARSLYLDAFVPLDDVEGTEEQDIVDKGWALVQQAAEQWIEECEKKSSSLVGSTYTPPKTKTASA